MAPERGPTVHAAKRGGNTNRTKNFADRCVGLATLLQGFRPHAVYRIDSIEHKIYSLTNIVLV
jgi:hypothetical protein